MNGVFKTRTEGISMSDDGCKDVSDRGKDLNDTIRAFNQFDVSITKLMLFLEFYFIILALIMLRFR